MYFIEKRMYKDFYNLLHFQCIIISFQFNLIFPEINIIEIIWFNMLNYQ